MKIWKKKRWSCAGCWLKRYLTSTALARSSAYIIKTESRCLLRCAKKRVAVTCSPGANMASQTVPFLLWKNSRACQDASHLRGFTLKLKPLVPFIGRHLQKSNLSLSAEDYLGLTLLNSILYLAIFMISFVTLQSLSALRALWSSGLITAAVSEVASHSINRSELY